MKNESIIFGIHPIEQAYRNTQLDKVYIQQGTTNDKLLSLAKEFNKANVSVQFVPIEKLNRLTKGNHQGIVAIASPISYLTLEVMAESVLDKTTTPLFLILDQISDVRNFGAILRTAECTGVDGIIIPKTGSAPLSADAVKTSVGAIFNVPIAKVDHVKDAIFYMKSSGIKTIAATEKTNSSIYDQILTEPIAIILGSEGKGVSAAVLNLVDEKASLPLLGDINSLNVSVACGAILYEVVRQRLK